MHPTEGSSPSWPVSSSRPPYLYRDPETRPTSAGTATTRHPERSVSTRPPLRSLPATRPRLPLPGGGADPEPAGLPRRQPGRLHSGGGGSAPAAARAVRSSASGGRRPPARQNHLLLLDGQARRRRQPGRDRRPDRIGLGSMVGLVRGRAAARGAAWWLAGPAPGVVRGSPRPPSAPGRPGAPGPRSSFAPDLYAWTTSRASRLHRRWRSPGSS